jgi:transcriptional regulator with XRE-family HTH domain
MNEGIFLNTIGQILSNQRRVFEITLQELSSKTGIDIEKIVEIEMGEISLDLEEFLKITDAIGIDAAKIMNEIN